MYWGMNHLRKEKPSILKFKVSGISKYMHWLLMPLAAFVFLFDLTLFLSIYLAPYFVGIIVVYVALLPLLASVKRKNTYFAVLPIPVLGSWGISIFYISTIPLPVMFGSVIASLVPIVLVTSVHLLSRMRNMIFAKPIASLSRVSSALSSSIFLLASILIPESVGIEVHAIYATGLYPMLLVAYVLSSMHFVNSKYRYRVLCQKLSMPRIETRMQNTWKEIENKFSGQQRDIDLLRYYSSGAVRSFEEGAYEESFISGYQAICEKTIVDPKNHVTDKRDGKPESFSEIRTILMHSRRKQTEIDVKKIIESKRELPKYCLEILKRDFELLEILSRNQRIEHKTDESLDQDMVK